MRKLFTRKELLLFIVILSSVGVLIYMWDFVWGFESPLLANIVAGLVIVAATIFGVNKVLAYREHVRWKQAKSGVLMEVSTCLNGMLTNIRGLAGIKLSDLFLPSTRGMSSDEWARNAGRIITEYFAKQSNPLARQIANRIKQCDQRSWDIFFDGLQSCIQELDRLMTMFPSVVSQPELVEGIVAVRGNAKLLFNIRITFPDVLGIPLEKQPMPRNGNREELSNQIHEFAIRSLDELIVSIVHAKEIVDKLL